MRILLTGATGLIGKEVGKLLVKEGYSVISLTRDAKKARLELPFPCEILEWKGVGTPVSAEFGTLLTSVDGVINLMGENLADHRWSPEFKDQMVKSRVQATEELIQAVLKHSVPKFWIQGSAIGIYGESKDVHHTESSPSASGFLAKLCEDWENTCRALPSITRTVFLRTGVVFSHRGGAFTKMLTPLLNGIGGVIGTGAQEMSLIHLEDAAQFVLHSVKNATVQGIYNLVSDHPITQKMLTQRLCVLLHVQQGPPAPAVALKFALGEMSDLLLQSQGVVSERIALTGFKFRYSGINELLAEVCSWHQHPFKPNHSAFIEYAEQFVPHELDQVFPFFSEAKNLESITPDWLNFKSKNVSTPQIEQGTKIRYRLKLHGVPMRWLTDIAEWQPPTLFVDNQVKGPYSLWYHEHTFERVPGGTLLKDWVRYQLPLGKVGQWFGLSKVRSDVSKIFKYRKEIIQEKFGS